MNSAFQSNNCFKYALIILATFLFLYQIYWVFNFPIWRDDAFFATVAKNLVNGNGFSAVFFDQDYKFHYGISSGPSLILPAAAMIFIFGNHYWVPELSAVLMIWSLLIAIFIASKEVVGEKKWAFCFLTLLMMMLFSGDEEGIKLSLWVRLMGEIPAALLVILAALIFSSKNLNNSKLASGGIILGLALMIKAIVAIAAGTILIIVATRIIFSKKPIIWIVIPAFCFVAPCFLFESIKIIVLGWKGYLELQQQNSNFYRTNAFFERPLLLYSLLPILIHFRFAAITFLPSIIYVVYSSGRKNLNSPYFVAGIALLLASFLHVSWWIVYAIPDAYRHLSIGIFCYFAGIFLLICKFEYKTQFQIFFVSIFIGSLIASCPDEIWKIFNNNSYLQEQKMIVEEMKSLQQQGVQLISCGNNFELEYLLPSARNFKECKNFLNNSPMSQKVMLINDFISSPEIIYPEVLYIASDDYFGAFVPIPNIALERCQERYYLTEHFSMLWCH